MDVDLGKAKVQNLGPAMFCDENIGRFDVSMDDALRVSDAQPFCNLYSQGQNSFDFNGPAR